MRTPSAKAKPSQSLRSVINATKKLWRQYHLTYDQTRYVAKEVRHALAVERPKMRKRVVARLSREAHEGGARSVNQDAVPNGNTGFRIREPQSGRCVL